ncbi:hypothetical protein O6H91_Y016900 [Diphasiastrum complanatum]|nr:hypothetical protein O6H91_Y016900 [Diphasiastrum complanatum]
MCMLSVCPCGADISVACDLRYGAGSVMHLEKNSIEDQTLINIPEVRPDNREAGETIKVVCGIELDLKRWPTLIEVIEELQQMSSIAGPMVMMGLLLYARNITSMLFLGRLGELELAGGSLSIGFANITGYSVLSGLAMGMEPICGQAYGAKRWHLIGLSLQRMILILLCACIPIGFLWLNTQRVLLWCGQDKDITAMAGAYILFCIPDLLAQAILNPLKIYLRTQGITAPLTWCTALAVIFHLPINLFLVFYLKMGVEGVALGAAWTNFNLCSFPGWLFVDFWGTRKELGRLVFRLFEGVKPLLSLAIPSCVFSVFRVVVV